MPADRWNWVRGIAITPEVDAVLDKQDRGEPLTSEDRRVINEAIAVINSETRGWERGDPWDRDEEPAPEPTGTPIPGTPEMPPSPSPAGNMTPSPTGTPTPTGTPPPTPGTAPVHPISGLPLAPNVPPPPFTAMPSPDDIDAPGQRPAQQITSPDDILTIQDGQGNQIVMTRREYDAQDPDVKSYMTVINAEGPGTRPTTTGNLPQAPAPPPDIGPPPSPAAATPPATGIAPIKLPPQPAINAPFQDDAPNRRPSPPAPATGRQPPERPGPKPAPGRTEPRPGAPKPAAPAPPSIAPPPFERDETGALLPESRLTRAVRQAGGRPTRPVTERVAREIGEVFRPGEQGGYRGDTGGWRTLAHQAANAWEEQYRADPNSLKASERAAYERNPQSLHDTILRPDSPFRDYRESWIGAARAGQGVPGAGEFTGELGQYGVGRPTGISDTTDRGNVPRETTPSSATRQGAPLPAAETPPTTSSAVPPPPDSRLDLSDLGGVPESELRPGGGIDLSDLGAVPESELRTPASATREGAPLTEGQPAEATVTVIDIGPPPELTPESPFAESPVARRRERAPSNLVAMMRSDANQPWPEPGQGAERAAAQESIDEIIEQGRAEGRSHREIADSLEMNGYGDADQWENSFIEEEMRFQQRQLNRYPPDGGGYLSPIPPPGEAPFYGPDIRVGVPENQDFYYDDQGNQVYYEDSPYYEREAPINYDEGGYPIFQAEDGGDYVTAYEEPSYEEPEYEEEVAYEEPSYDYEEEWVEEYA